MTQVLKQSTAVDVLIGPFVDKTDGATAETGESPSVKLSKNGQTLAAKNDVTTPVHDADGYYNCELDATDTNTVGTLVLTVAASANALPVRHEFQVVEEATYDFLYASGATPIADINAEVDTALADVNLDHLVGTATGIPSVPAGTFLDQIMDDGTASFDRTTDSLQALRDRGDAAWITATGFSTHSAADVWTSGTRTLTANTNLNDPTAAVIADAVWDEAKAGHVGAGSFGEEVQAHALSSEISALNDLSAAEVNAEVLDIMNVDTITLPGQTAPPATPTHRQAIGWLYKVFRNKKDQDAATWQLYDDAGTTVDAKATVSDDGTTATKGEVGTGP